VIPLVVELSDVICPSCFEVFSVAIPYPTERPAELDYDCEVCCRPMFIEVNEVGDAYAVSLED